MHYLNHDRRLDEWCSISRFQLESLDSSHRHVTLQKQHTGGRKRKSAASDAMLKANQELAELEREHEEMTKVKNIHNIVIGNWDVETWYFSPYPSEFSPCETLYICEYCLKYMKLKCSYRKHRQCCEKRRPPGREIYRENNLSVFEIDGKEHRVCKLFGVCLLFAVCGGGLSDDYPWGLIESNAHVFCQMHNVFCRLPKFVLVGQIILRS